MRTLTALTYYRPHTSGLTIYAERLARAFARRGHEVTVMTTQYDKSLPREEVLDEVRIVRIPVAARISKGVLAPSFGLVATEQVLRHDIIHLHLPQFDAPGVALRARLLGKPAILTYHCDLNLPPGAFNRIVNKVVQFQNMLAGHLASHIVTYTQDYADHSTYLSRYKHKLSAILPPVELPQATLEEVETFALEHQTKTRRPVIGMVTRFAAEKGVEILLEAIPAVRDRHPNLQVLFAGQHLNVMGEKQYFNRLAPRIKEYEREGVWKFLGNLSQQQLSAFYPNIDVLVVPSLNSTEAFGLVQVEAMLHGVPCVASALPGVRRPVQMHGMGEVVPIGDSRSLASALLRVLENKNQYPYDRGTIAQSYQPDAVAQEYERLFQQFMN